MARNLILIRHGEIAGDCRGRYIGRTDVSLSAEGSRQAESLAAVLESFGDVRILCSPLLRARRTAEISLKGRNFSIDRDLREIDFGRWEGMSFSQIVAADPFAVDRWAALDDEFAFPDGEGIGAFRKRIRVVAGRIAADSAETLIAFTHGGVIRLLICHFLGLKARDYLLFDVGTASLSEIRIEDEKGVLTRLNDRHHLDGFRQKGHGRA